VRIATITPVWNERELLPHFLAHYGPRVDTIFILDNESDDGSVELARSLPNAVVSSFSSGGEYRDSIKHQAVESKRAECAGYDHVLVVDADEFVVPKDGRRIADVLADLADVRQDFVWTHGFEMFAAPDDPPYDPSVPLLRQRRHGFESEKYSKAAILRSTAAVVFEPGFHKIKDVCKPSLDDLRRSPFFLLHYAGLDEAFFVKRSLSRTARMSAENVERGWAVEYLGGTEASFRERFRFLSGRLAPVALPASYV
jgi:glycosyltransferase involved in cell wall biosynthesis